MTDNYAEALARIEAVHTTRQTLRDMYRDRDRNPSHVAALSHDLGDALKLADVHATLAVVDVLDDLVDQLRSVGPAILALYEGVEIRQAG